MPKRIQRRRSKGWRMPEGAVYVGRPSKWGNPFRPGHHYRRDAHAGIPRMNLRFIYLEAYEGHQDATFTTLGSVSEALEWYRWYLGAAPLPATELRGKDLACWCPPDQPCHADVLLEIANGKTGA